MWDKDTWQNNRCNTSVKLLWLFGLVEYSHCSKEYYTNAGSYEPPNAERGLFYSMCAAAAHLRVLSSSCATKISVKPPPPSLKVS